MSEISHYATGIDVGTENVRAVVLAVDDEGKVSVVGFGEAPNAGMRKGVVANLAGPAEAIDKMLAEVERMSGYEVNSAYVSVNGASVMSTRANGMIAVGADNKEIDNADLDRVEDAAVTGRVPANRDVLMVLPLEYALDGQAGIKDPIGMTGARLEIKANVISVLTPNAVNLKKALTEGANVAVTRLIPSVMASARAVLSERQMENGVALIDMGAATTSVAVFEEGDLQFLGVIPMGSNNVTNDLAIVLQIDTEEAEDIKLRFVSGAFEDSDKDIIVKRGREEIVFSRNEVNDIVQARLGEIFGDVRKLLKSAHYDQKLPEGIVLVGGGAKMRDIEVFAKEALEAAIRVGTPNKLGGVSDTICKPDYAAAIGLALLAAQDGQAGVQKNVKHKSKKSSGKEGFIKKLFKKF